MSVSLSSIPVMLKDRSYHGGMLKGSPVRGYFPGPLPGPHNPYIDFFPRTNNLLNPLKSLGRLVSDTPGHLPLSLPGGAPPYLGHGVQHAPVLQEHVLSTSGLPYLSQMLPGHTLYSKPEELAAVVTEHAAGPLSSDFSSPSSERSASSAGSSSPPKGRLYRLGSADPSPKKTRVSYNFTEDELFMVLYGYSSNQESNVGHAISGVALPEKPGKTCAAVASTYFKCQNSTPHLKMSPPVSDSHPLPLDKQALELPEGKPRRLYHITCGSGVRFNSRDFQGSPSSRRAGGACPIAECSRTRASSTKGRASDLSRENWSTPVRSRPTMTTL